MRIIKRVIVILSIIFVVMFGVAYELKKFFPNKYFDLVERYAAEYEVDPLLVLSIIKVESNFDERALSQRGAKGLMQIMESTAVWASKKMKILDHTEDRLYNADYNIRIGVWYIKWLYDKYQDIDLAIVAYNGGMGNVDKWLLDKKYSSDGKKLDVIPFEETNNYLFKVKFAYKGYKVLYG